MKCAKDIASTLCKALLDKKLKLFHLASDVCHEPTVGDSYCITFPKCDFEAENIHDFTKPIHFRFSVDSGFLYYSSISALVITFATPHSSQCKTRSSFLNYIYKAGKPRHIKNPYLQGKKYILS